jgi:ABC-type amino acid transport substrate-binding protein
MSNGDPIKRIQMPCLDPNAPQRASTSFREQNKFNRIQRVILTLALSALGLPTISGDGPVNAQTAAAFGADTNTNRPVRVIWSPDPPYALSHGGVPTGLEIDLWRTIAETRQIPYQIERAESWKALLAAVSTGKADIGMGGILIDENRSKRFHFSFPTAASTLKVYALADKKPTALKLIEILISKQTLLILLGLILIVCFFAVPVWAIERRRPEFEGTRKRHQLIFILQKTLLLSTDHTKQTRTRLISIVSLFARVILTAYFASYILEVARSSDSETTGAQITHLSNAISWQRTFAAVPGSIQESILQSAGAKTINCELMKECITLLESGQADAILSDTQSMARATEERQNGHTIIAETNDLMPLFSAYAFSNTFSQDPRSRSINDAIARSYYDGTYNELNIKWLQ